MAGSKSEVDETNAFSAWVDMGNGRSINGLLTILKNSGHKIGRQTLINWHAKNDWPRRLEEALIGRELEAEAVQAAEKAREHLAAADARPKAETRELTTVRVTDLSAEESIEATAMRLNGLVVLMTEKCLEQVNRIDGYLELRELCQLINTTRDLARAAGDVHRAVLQLPSKPKKGEEEDDLKVMAPAIPPGAFIPTDIERRKAALLDPPRLRQT